MIVQEWLNKDSTRRIVAVTGSSCGWTVTLTRRWTPMMQPEREKRWIGVGPTLEAATENALAKAEPRRKQKELPWIPQATQARGIKGLR